MIHPQNTVKYLIQRKSELSAENNRLRNDTDQYARKKVQENQQELRLIKKQLNALFRKVRT